jgi:hypothetical protein
MGAQDFANEYRGTATIEEAYATLVDQALWDHGHAGYTGTIGESRGFVLDPGVKAPMTSEDAYKRAHDWEREDGPEKWGPAWAIPLLPQPDWVDPHGGRYVPQYDPREAGWLFYGIASC